MDNLNFEFQPVAPGVYQKWNPVLGIRTTVWFTGTGPDRKMTVRHEQPKQLIKDVLDLNVKRQNDFNGYKGKEMVQATSLPIAVHEQIKRMCGFKPGQGYDQKKFRQIINDRDYYKLRTVPGKI